MIEIPISEPFEPTGRSPEQNVLITPKLLELLRWNFGPVNKISLGIFSSQNHIAPEVLRMCNDLFQNVVRLYRPFLDIFKQFLSFSG